MALLVMSWFLLIFFRENQRVSYKQKADEKAAEEWHSISERIHEYVVGFYKKLGENIQCKNGRSLEEIDLIDPYETVTYKNLLKEKHVAYITYLERNTFLIKQAELIVLLKEIKDDEALYNRTMNLILSITTP